MLAVEVIIRSDEYMSAGVELQKVFAPLSQYTFRHNKQRLFDNAELPQFHGSGRHFGGLARAHCMCDQGVTAGRNNTLHGVFLVRPQCLGSGKPIDGEVAAVIVRIYEAVKGVVINARHGIAPSIIFPQPALKFFPDLVGLFIRRDGGILIGVILAVLVLVSHFDIAAVKDILKQL